MFWRIEVLLVIMKKKLISNLLITSKFSKQTTIIIAVSENSVHS